VTILVPPTVFLEVQAVFYLPLAAKSILKLRRSDRARIGAADEIPGFVKQNNIIGRSNFPIGADGDLTSRNVQTLTDILGVVQVDPDTTDIAAAPFLSTVSWAGRFDAASAKHVFKASSISGWLALT
jgi:hypothetical protein